MSLVNHQPIADETSSATSGLVDLTVNCIATPSDKTNFARNRISNPPRKQPGNKYKFRFCNSFLNTKI